MHHHLATDDPLLHEFIRTLRYSYKLGDATAYQYASFVRAAKGSMKDPNDQVAFTTYVALRSPRSRIGIQTAWNRWLVFLAHKSGVKAGSEKEKAFLARNACYPSEEMIALVRSRLHPEAPPTEVLQAIRVLSAICEVGPHRIAATRWSSFRPRTDGGVGFELSVRRGGRGRTYCQILGPPALEALTVLQRHYFEAPQTPDPAAVLIPAGIGDRTVPATRKQIEGWLRAAKVESATPEIKAAVRANREGLEPAGRVYVGEAGSTSSGGAGNDGIPMK